MKRDVPHFRIGLLLTEAGILAPQQLDDAIRQGETDGTPFLRVLVGSGELKQHELQAVIRAQSLIWSGLLDVERAIKALTIVHADDVTIDEGLRSVGWIRPENTMGDTIVSSVQVKTKPETVRPSNGNGAPVNCQYCGTTLNPGEVLCSFCTGENNRGNSGVRLAIEPAWQRQAIPSDGSRIVATIPARNPLFMAFLSGCCAAGLGQVLIGQSAKGVSLIVISLLLGFASSGVASLVLFPLAALDAYLLADKLRNGKTVGMWEFF